MTLDEGQVLFYEGDLGQNLYVVRNGELQGTNTRNGDINTYGPGALLGELSLIKNEPSPETVTATEESELLEITPEVFNSTLEKEPVWFKSIIQFLTGRLSIAQVNKHKSDKIKALPSLLYILDSLSSRAKGDCGIEISMTDIVGSVHNLFNSVSYDIEELLQILEELDVLKVQATTVLVKNANVIHLLYESIRYRAQFKKTPPQILSMTEQMVLNAVIKTVQQSNAPLKNGTFTVQTASLLNVSKRAMFGATLTSRTLLPLLERKLLKASIPLNKGDILPEIQAIPSFSGDFDTILDLMELNRIYPLLDKKLVK